MNDDGDWKAKAEAEDKLGRCAVCATGDHDTCDGVAVLATGGHGPCDCKCSRATMVRKAVASMAMPDLEVMHAIAATLGRNLRILDSAEGHYEQPPEGNPVRVLLVEHVRAMLDACAANLAQGFTGRVLR